MSSGTAESSWEDDIESIQLYAFYGMFMAAWAKFDAVLDLIIMQETRLTRVKGIIVCSGLAFERKSSIARSLLALHGDRHKATITLINTITSEAERNWLVHGLVGTELKTLEFIKRSTDQKLAVKIQTLDQPGMLAKLNKLLGRLRELTAAVGITHGHVEVYQRAHASLVSKASTSPRPPSSKSSP